MSKLFRKITSNNHGDFYCLNCLHSFRTDNALKKHEGFCENDDYCSVEMPTNLNKIWKYNRGEKSLKTPFVIYADLEYLLLKQKSCQNNPNKCYTKRKAIHEPCGYSLDLVCSFDFKKIVSLYQSQKQCYICGKALFYDKKQEKIFKLYKKVRDHCYFTGKFRGAAHCICDLRYKVPQEIPVKIHNGSNYDFYLKIKELAEALRGEDFECLDEKTDKYTSFSVPIKKERDNDSGETVTYKSLLIVLDSCKVDYQILLITCLKLIRKIAKHAWKEKILNQNVNLLGLSIKD